MVMAVGIGPFPVCKVPCVFFSANTSPAREAAAPAKAVFLKKFLRFIFSYIPIKKLNDAISKNFPART
jgi:hypothetical protein